MGRKIDDICQSRKNDKLAGIDLKFSNYLLFGCFPDFSCAIGIVLAAMKKDCVARKIDVY